MLYHLYELSHAAMSPARAAANSTRLLLRNPFNPLSYTNLGRNAAAAAELMERTTRRYKKLGFNIKSTTVKGKRVADLRRNRLAQVVLRSHPFQEGVAGRRPERASAPDGRAFVGSLSPRFCAELSKRCFPIPTCTSRIGTTPG